MPMPGITIGEIGNKLGMNGVNNGFLGFKNVRIPRGNMLMKNAKLLEDGTFVKPPSSVLTYGTMMFVRVVIVRDMANYLSKAVTIATRYSCVRRQSVINPEYVRTVVFDFIISCKSNLSYLHSTVSPRCKSLTILPNNTSYFQLSPKVLFSN